MENGAGCNVNLGANSGDEKVIPTSKPGVLSNSAIPTGQGGPVPGVPKTQKR